ncbi:hypothetical protein ACKWTF_006603 [Chironomus riparius]
MEVLPDEVLLDVFRHIKNDCDQVKQVCMRFYLLICQLNKSKLCLAISDKQLQDPETYDSMVYSKRIFSKMALNTNNVQSLNSFWKLRTICSLKAPTITELTWDLAKMTSTEIVFILNFFSNLKTLKCNSWKIETDYYDEPIDTLQLESLKFLSIIKCNEATTSMFINYLPANSLTKLETDFYSSILISNNSGLNDLNFTVDEISHDWVPVPLIHLSMRLQKYRHNNHPVLLSILPQQPNLISFDVLSCNGIFDEDDESFITMCSLKHLKVLKMNIDDINHAVFKENFRKLNQLKELHIESVDGDYHSLIDNIEELSNTRLEHLKILNIDVEHIGIPLNRIEHMGMNFPCLTNLAYKCERPLPIDIYIRNFRALTDLEINYHYSQEFSLMCSNLDGITYPNINTIKLKGFNFGSDANFNEPAFSKLVKVVPNISDMEIEVNMPLNTKFLDNNLQKLSKLKIFKDLTLMQQKENYEKFDTACVNYLLSVCEKLDSFTVELKLNAIDMDVHVMKTMLSAKFKFNMKRLGSQIVIELGVKQANKRTTEN